MWGQQGVAECTLHLFVQLALVEGKSTLENALKEGSTVLQLYQATLALKALGSSCESLS